MTAPSLGPDRVTARVPAKINLELLVGPVREDGFHALTTIYQAVNLHDEVTAEYADGWSIEVQGPGCQGVPVDDTNLALRAARLLADRADVLDPDALTIHKTIPVAGGMAGGSADAAAALVVAGRGATLVEGVAVAAEALDGGGAARLLDAWIAYP